MANPNDANIIVNGQKVVATVAQSGTVVKDGGEIDATSIIQTSDGLQKVVKVMDVNGGGGGGSTEQNIKAYHAPSATLDQTLAIVIPNVDAVQEEGLYNVDYTIENEGSALNANCILSVGTVNVSGQVMQVDQTMVIGLNGSYVYLNRNYIGGQWSAWSGKNIPVELAKCLQNSSTASGSLSLLGYSTRDANSINIGRYSNSAQGGLALGNSAYATQVATVAIGSCSTTGQFAISITPNGGESSSVTGKNAIQLGKGNNSTEKLFQVYEYPMLDGNTGLIPLERLGTGYDATKTQVLKHINGVATWVDE